MISAARFDCNGFAAYLIRHGGRIVPLPVERPQVLICYEINDDYYEVEHDAFGAVALEAAPQLHYENFLARRPIWGRPGDRGGGRVATRDVLVVTLLQRDGAACCLCGEPLGEDITIEHWLASAHGGNNRLPNLGLAHAGCNNMAGSLGVQEKIWLRDELHDNPPQRLPDTAQALAEAVEQD